MDLTAAPVTVGLRTREGDIDLGTIAAAQLPAPVAATARVAVAMATHDPPPQLLEAQVASLRAQTFTDWVCVISDDGSDPRRLAVLEALIDGDARFVLSCAERTAGFYANFERALALVPADVELVALADQDDRWHRDKLRRLVAAIGDAQLVYSDTRVVTPDGAVVSDTYWRDRDNDHEDLRSLLVANCVSGAASLFRRDLLDLALPFPPAQFAHYHDHWIALCARVRGRIAYVPEPLSDYVQHGDAVLGHAGANTVVGMRERFETLRRDPGARIDLYRDTYFADVARLVPFARTLLLREPGMAPEARDTLEAFLAAETSLPAAARLWLAGAREYAGRPRTLGAERGLAYAFAWRRAAASGRLDATPPADLTRPPRLRRAAPAVPTRG